MGHQQGTKIYPPVFDSDVGSLSDKNILSELSGEWSDFFRKEFGLDWGHISCNIKMSMGNTLLYQHQHSSLLMQS